MIVYFCDDCGKQVLRTTPSAPLVEPDNTIHWGGMLGASIYHFCSKECRQNGALDLSQGRIIGPRKYECDREPVPVGMVH